MQVLFEVPETDTQLENRFLNQVSRLNRLRLVMLTCAIIC